jgi:predicted LPLAT superfamily acyltransferase
MKEWNGKSKGSLLGYKIFVFIIRFLGLRTAYFLCFFVSLYFFLFHIKERKALVKFYTKTFNDSFFKARINSLKCFYNFGVILIDRVALKTKLKSKFTFIFNNEQSLLDINERNDGAILVSAHIGNWEIAGDFLYERITKKINVLMLDAEVQKIKNFLKDSTGGVNFNPIAIKNDFSHLIKFNKAIKEKEIVALHADRIYNEAKIIKGNLLGNSINLPQGPFKLMTKFKVPISFVYAFRSGAMTYELYANTISSDITSEEELSKAYCDSLGEFLKKYPTQWFNFYNYYEE